MLARWVLLLTAFAYAGIGVLFLGWPDVMGRVAGLDPSDALALNDLRAVYGGLQLALAVFFVVASRQRAWHPAALWLQMLTFGGLAAGRLLSLALDGSPGTLGFVLHGLEILGLACGILAFRSLPYRSQPFRSNPGSPGEGDITDDDEIA